MKVKKVIVFIAVAIIVAGLVSGVACQGATGPPGPPGESSISSSEEAMIAFTEQALGIEDEHNQIIAKYASYISPLRSGTQYAWEISLLANRIVLLDCPQSLQPIKDALLRSYDMESKATEVEKDFWLDAHYDVRGNLQAYELRMTEHSDFYPAIDIHNVQSLSEDDWRRTMYPTWVEAQMFRLEVYDRWKEILEQYDIDLRKEGFIKLLIWADAL